MASEPPLIRPEKLEAVHRALEEKQRRARRLRWQRRRERVLGFWRRLFGR